MADGTAWRWQGRSPAESKLAAINVAAVVIPLLGFGLAVYLSWGVALGWMLIGILAVMSVSTALGVTVGFHRLCTHKSFKTPGIVRYALAVVGSMAVQGPVIRWCAEHRRHHHHSDTEGDPHSPHMGANGSWGEGFWATLHGAYHAHVGWLFADRTKGLGRYSVDLWRDRALVLADKQFPFWVLFGLLLPAVVAGLFTHTWSGAFLGFLWGGLVRVLLVHHITWSVNSICHLWGTRPFDSHDESRNNLLVGILAMGEGWHNNHHAFPTSARHGLRWYEIDVSYWFIRTLKFCRLATDIRTPSPDRIATKREAAKAP